MLPNLLPPKTAQPSFLLGLTLIAIASAGCGSSDAASTPSAEPADTTQTSMVTDESRTPEPEITTSSTTEALSTDDTINVTFETDAQTGIENCNPIAPNTLGQDGTRWDERSEA